MIGIPCSRSRSAALSMVPDQAQTKIGAADSGVPNNQLKAVASLVDAEQRAAHRDLTYQAPPVRSVIQMGAGTEQPAVDRAACSHPASYPFVATPLTTAR